MDTDLMEPETETGKWWEDGRNVTAVAGWYVGCRAQDTSPAAAALTVFDLYEAPWHCDHIWQDFLDARPVG